jgi:Flp pilus assembly protein TadD
MMMIMNANILKHAPKLILVLSACTMLSACKTTQGAQGGPNTKIDAAVQRAAEDADAQGKSLPLSTAEKLYTKDSSNPDNAIKYAVALREAGYANRASVVLEPFADDPKDPPAAKSEFAAIQLALGNNESAEKYAQKAVLGNPNDAKAFHYLGIALDAQGKHPEAERAFRKGLDMWKGDPTPIMNNLALNLSAQGFLDEAVEILEKAKAVAPNRVEVERNLRIVTALRQSGNPTTPKPGKKPVPSKD